MCQSRHSGSMLIQFAPEGRTDHRRPIDDACLGVKEHATDRPGRGRGAPSGASVRFDDLVRALLMTNDLTYAIEIALERLGGNDERCLEILEFAGPTG